MTGRWRIVVSPHLVLDIVAPSWFQARAEARRWSHEKGLRLSDADIDTMMVPVLSQARAA